MSKSNAEAGSYPGSRVQNNNLSFSSVESNKYKIDGNGKWRYFIFQHISISHLLIEYIEDLCPYATFQLNKQTYSESSYSGNVYSGPYHSVRGSFVYHDNKDSYRVSMDDFISSLFFFCRPFFKIKMSFCLGDSILFICVVY